MLIGQDCISEVKLQTSLLFIPSDDICVWTTSGMIWTKENQITQEKTCPSVTLSTEKPAWTDLDVNLDLCGEKPETNHLSYGKALGREADKYSQ
jgi:hypothetical protein